MRGDQVRVAGIVAGNVVPVLERMDGDGPAASARSAMIGGVLAAARASSVA